MRVIEITGEPILHGGQEKFIENLVENIDYSNLEIDVLTPYYCDNDIFREKIEKRGGHIYELKLNFLPGKSRQLIYKPILKYLYNNHYDVAHIHSGSISVLAYASLAAKKAEVKKIIVHSHCIGISSMKHKLIRFGFGFLIRKNATDFLACSKDAGKMKYHKDIAKKRLVVVKNGIPYEKFAYNPDTCFRIREKLNIPETAYVLGHVGRFSIEKNHKYLIDIFIDVLKKIPNSYLLLIGDGELHDKIKSVVFKLGLEKNIIFLGNVDDVHSYYQAMNVFLLPSLYEGLSLVTIEAQAAGLPCVLSMGVPSTAVLSDNAVRLPLERKDLWIKKIVSLKGTKPVDNSKKIRLAGYDIKKTAIQIRKIYFRNNKKD